MAGTSARKRPERLAASPCWPGPGFARADGLPPVDGRDADRGFAPAAGIGVVLPKLFKPPLQCRRSPRRRRWWPPTIRPPTVPSCSRSVPILISSCRLSRSRSAQGSSKCSGQLASVQADLIRAKGLGDDLDRFADTSLDKGAEPDTLPRRRAASQSAALLLAFRRGQG
jgi:hypothetical protein